MHVQSCTLSLVPRESELAGHAEHPTFPGTSLYVPAVHPAQDAPVPVNPGSHTQMELPAEDCALLVHALQSREAAVSWYVPAAQSLHGPDPAVALCLPAPQAVHEAPSPV